MRIHPVFHISKLYPYETSDNELQRDGVLPSAVIIDGEEQWEVDRIVKHRFFKGNKEYRVKWTGYPMSANTWENAEEMLATSREIVEEYEMKN